MLNLRLSDIRASLARDLLHTVREAEEGYAEKVRAVAERLGEGKERKVLLLAGPSSAGKTTTSRLLRRALEKSGHSATVLSLDDFYRNPEEPEYPRTDAGALDYEAPDAIDIPLVHDCIETVLAGGTYPAPLFDFEAHRRAEKVQPIALPAGGVLIIEGLHALNPRLCEGLSRTSVLRMFISVSTNINGDAGARIISGRRVRFLRRMCRDALYRNSDAANTYALWQNVRRGENLFLYPHRGAADITLNTFHPYEIGVLRPYAERLLAAENAPRDAYIDEIRTALAYFEPLSTEIVPQESLLREFLPPPRKNSGGQVRCSSPHPSPIAGSPSGLVCGAPPCPCSFFAAREIAAWCFVAPSTQGARRRLLRRRPFCSARRAPLALFSRPGK